MLCEEISSIIHIKRSVSLYLKKHKKDKNKSVNDYLVQIGIEEWKIDFFKGDISLKQMSIGYIFLIGSRIRTLIVIIVVISL